MVYGGIYMKVTKKITIASLLASFVLLIGLAFGVSDLSAKRALAAESTDISHYFYSQLTDDQKEFYRAMEKMNSDGYFKKGADYDLLANGHVTKEQLQEYADGSSELLYAMGAARDAFYTDYADIFYVDFSYLSLRVTQGSDGFHAYLGKGRGDTYYLEGFASESDVNKAIGKYNTAVNAVVAEVNAAKPTEQQVKAFGSELATQVAKIQKAHQWIALNTIYKLEDNASEGNRGHVRTPYGVFVAKSKDAYRLDQGEALCEGYSRAFKVLMDKIGVPCVLVNGAYRHSETQLELHMWTHVQLLDGKWYAVDQTFDDLNLKKPNDGLPYTEFGKAYNEDYFLKGSAYMNTQHATSPYKSEVEYPFTYPKLADHNFGLEISTAHRGGLIQVTQEPYDFKADSTTITVSVFIDPDGDGEGEWCGYVKAAKKGYYIVQRHEGHYLPEQILRASQGDLSDPNYDLQKAEYNLSMVWAYLSPFKENADGTIESLYGSVQESESGDKSIITDYSKQTGFEFALTDVPPRPLGDTNDPDKAAEMTTYSGDPSIFIARTGLIQTLYGDPDYAPAPHIVKASPVLTGKLAIGYTYNVTAEYDQWLELMNGDEKIKMSVVGVRATGEILRGTNALVLEDVVDLSTLTWDPGDETKFGSISFTFTPSPMYAHDNVLYYFNFNLQGVNSKKQVNPITHVGAYESDACCYKANGFHWKVWAQPQLLENDDLSTEGWVTSDGTDVSQTKSRLALVVTTPTKKQEGQMNGLLEDELGLNHQESTKDGNINEEAFQSFTYNISLTICKGVVLETYQGVRVSIGFPEGFTYDDSLNGVTFKGYHFIHDAQNNVIGVEELEIVVTPLGLILTCYSFSPFAIVAVKTDDLPEDARPQPTTDKTIIISASNSGTAYADVDGKQSNLFTLKEGESTKLTVRANSGSIIESVKVGDKLYASNSEELKLTCSYSDFASGQNIIEVKFVAKTVKATEESRGEGAVVQNADNFVLQQLKGALISVVKKFAARVGGIVELKPTVTAYGDTNTYQWYKDGKALENQTDTTLTIQNVALSDAGNYTLQVTSESNGVSVMSISNEINVTVSNGSSLSELAILGITLGALTVFAVAIIVPVVLVAKKKSEK